MNLICRLLLPALFLQTLACSTSVSQSDLTTRDVVTGLDTPWEIIWGPDNWIWVTERPGMVSRVNPESGEKRTILTLTDIYEGDGIETGLLGMALHPEFATTPYVYVVYTYNRGPQVLERLERYTYDGNALVSPQVLLDSIPGFDTHVGSRLAVSPDGMLFMSTGDRQNQPGAQSHTQITGKVLRMTLDGTVPADNPWPRNPWPESLIWSTGHRNHQGLAFDPAGRLYSSEHGPNNDDELNLIEKGRNYGWPNVEGLCDRPTETTFCSDSNVFQPLIAWTPTIAPAGLAYYSHTRIPLLQNRLLMVSLNSNGSDLRSFHLSDDGRRLLGETIYFDGTFGRLRDLCVSPDGRLFISTSNRDGRGSVRSGDDRIIEIVQPGSVADDPGGRSGGTAAPQPLITESLISFGRHLGSGHVALFDALGTCVWRAEFEGGANYRLMRNGMASGVYFVAVSDRAGTLRLPVVFR